MAAAKKCDRCGTYHDGRIYKLTTRDPSPFEYNEREFDLCDECMNEFDDFMGVVKPKDLRSRLQAMFK